jgi:hypothetical protein
MRTVPGVPKGEKDYAEKSQTAKQNRDLSYYDARSEPAADFS